jgi:hypothetical protein
MVRIAFTNSWIGISLAILCLGVNGCCTDRACKPPLPSGSCINHLPRRPCVLGPGYGYHPTCWMSWSDWCPSCPPRGQVFANPQGAVSNRPSADGNWWLPDESMELVPMPQGEAQPKVAEPAKGKERPPIAEEPPKPEEPPKLQEPPKAKEPLPKSQKVSKAVAPLIETDSLPPLCEIEFPKDISNYLEPTHVGWGESPFPERYAMSPGSKPLPAKMDIPARPGCTLRIFDSGSDGGEVTLAKKIRGLMAIAPEGSDGIPEVRQVVFREAEDAASGSQQDN